MKLRARVMVALALGLCVPAPATAHPASGIHVWLVDTWTRHPVVRDEAVLVVARRPGAMPRGAIALRVLPVPDWVGTHHPNAEPLRRVPPIVTEDARLGHRYEVDLSRAVPDGAMQTMAAFATYPGGRSARQLFIIDRRAPDLDAYDWAVCAGACTGSPVGAVEQDGREQVSFRAFDEGGIGDIDIAITDLVAGTVTRGSLGSCANDTTVSRTERWCDVRHDRHGHPGYYEAVITVTDVVGNRTTDSARFAILRPAA